MIRFAITRGLAALIGATLVLSILTPQRALAAPTQITWTPSTLHTSPDSINCENPGFCPALLKIAVDYHGNNIFTGDFGGHNLFHSNDGGENFSLTTLVGREPSSSSGIAYYSQDGTHIVLARICNLWRSVDSGLTFNRIFDGGTDLACFHDVAASRNGEVIVAVASGSNGYNRKDGIFVSINGGDTWSPHEASVNYETIHTWKSVAINDDGSQIIVTAEDGTISTSQNLGSTWVTTPLASPAGNWNSVSMANDLQHVVMTDNDRIYKWNILTNVLTQIGEIGSWKKIVSSQDGTILGALKDVYDPISDSTIREVWLSTNSGADWSQVINSGSPSYFDIALSRDGTKLVGSADGSVYHLTVVPSSSDSSDPTVNIEIPASTLSPQGKLRIFRTDGGIGCAAPSYLYSFHGQGQSLETPTSVTWNLLADTKIIDSLRVDSSTAIFSQPKSDKKSKYYCQEIVKFRDATATVDSHNRGREMEIENLLRQNISSATSHYWLDRSVANSMRVQKYAALGSQLNWKTLFSEVTKQWRIELELASTNRTTANNLAKDFALGELAEAGISISL